MELLECSCSGMRLGWGPGVDGVAAGGGGGARRALCNCAPPPPLRRAKAGLWAEEEATCTRERSGIGRKEALGDLHQQIEPKVNHYVCVCVSLVPHSILVQRRCFGPLNRSSTHIRADKLLRCISIVCLSFSIRRSGDAVQNLQQGVTEPISR